MKEEPLTDIRFCNSSSALTSVGGGEQVHCLPADLPHLVYDWKVQEISTLTSAWELESGSGKNIPDLALLNEVLGSCFLFPEPQFLHVWS